VSCECVEVIKEIPWFDTVDQEHIPLEIVNKCNFSINLSINISADKETLYVTKIKIPGLGKHRIEVVTDKYYEALDINLSLVEENKEVCKRFIKLTLR
jgi:hypothetical protein